MSFKTARKIFSIIFLVLIFLGSGYNMYAQRKAFSALCQELVPPKSLAAVRLDVSLTEEAVNTHISGKFSLIDAYGYIHNLLGKSEMSDFSQVRDIHGSLNYGNPFPVDTGSAQMLARRVARLKKAADKQNAKMLFVSPPDLVVQGYTAFEPGLPFQDMNYMIDAFLFHLRQYGVPILDTRYSLKEGGLPLSMFSYKGDHHWTNEAAFAASGDIVAALNDKYAAGLDPDGYFRDKNNYHTRTYQGIFIGSLGRGTGLAFNGAEDYTIIWPKFEAEYTVEIIDLMGRYLRRNGPTEKTLLYPNALVQRTPYMMLPENFYLTGVAPWMRIVNHDHPERPRLLMVNDSYSMPLVTFLAPLFSEIHMIWPLAENPVQVDRYMAENKFDYVIVELFSANISNEGVHFFMTDDKQPQ